MDLGSVEYVLPSDVPGKSDVFRSYYYGGTYNGKYNLWNGTTVCQWAFLVAFAPLGGAWCCFRIRLRMKGG
jgi:hypothetical protein